MDSRVARVVVCLLIAGGAVAPVSANASAGEIRASPSDFRTDNTVTRIDVHENGSATWTLQIRTRLVNDDNVSKYRAFQTRFRENTSKYLDPYRKRIRAIVGNAEEITGREMRASKFSASTTIQPVPRRWGVVTYRFTWTNFTDVRNDRHVVGDVFQGGFYIAKEDTLEVSAPPNHTIESVAPSPDQQGDGTVSWSGERDFADTRPKVVFAPAEASSGGTGGQNNSSLVPGGPISTYWLGGGVLAFVALAVVAVRRWDVGGGSVGSVAGAGDDSPPGPDAGETEPDAPAPEPEPDEQLLVDEDRVKRLLKRNNGRMRQKAIAEELDWSDSKTSRVLSRMTDNESVEKLRLGRENVIDLTEGAGSESEQSARDAP